MSSFAAAVVVSGALALSLSRKRTQETTLLSSLEWGMSPASIARRAKAVIAAVDACLDAVAAAVGEPGGVSFENTIYAMAALERDVEVTCSSISFMKDVSPDEAIRAAVRWA